MTHMILLGVGTAVPDADRENTHMLWTGPGGPLLIDAGGSAYQRLLRAGVEPNDLRGILLTHGHPDHIHGLVSIVFALGLVGRTLPLPVYGLPTTLELVQRIVAAYELGEYMVAVDWTTLEEYTTLALADDWTLKTAPTRHSRPGLALRFEQRSTGRALAYSGDTAPCAPVAELARNAHTLIHEATTMEPGAVHTTPHEAGELAQRAGARRLVLVHYSPRWTASEPRTLESVQAAGYTGVVEIGREYQHLEL